jgi:polysaccharide biosynthesis/export protein
MKSGVLATWALVILTAGLCRAALGGEQAAATVLENLNFEESGRGATIALNFSGIAPAFSCAVPAAGASELVIDLPGTRTRLPDKLDLKNSVVPEASLEKAESDGAGLRVRLVIKKGSLTWVEQSAHALLLRFVRSSAAGDSEYHVGVGDKLEINVFGHDDLSKIVEVRADGSINYPLIGDLEVAGKTVAEVDGEVTRILGKDYLVDPQVSVDVREYQSQWVTIIGEVRTPGKYVLKRNMRLIDLLAEAGGATKEAGSEILITRQTGDGTSRQIVVDRERLLTQDNQDSNPPMRHGDIVSVSEKQVFYIRGEVAKPGAYLLDSDITVQKAISLAGGFTQFANRKQVDILRAGEGGIQEKLTVNLKAIEDGKKKDVPIHANDTIIVPRRIF